MLRNVLVVGSGSAGLIAALTIKRRFPQCTVRVLRSSDIGVIGVGESTTPNVPFHLFEWLGIDRRRFYAVAEPTWKMGIHFLWGPRASFEHSFEPQLDVRLPELPRPNGYYCDDDFSNLNPTSALMSHGKVFARQPNGGGPEIPSGHAFHLENHKFVKFLEMIAHERDIQFIEGKLQGVERGPAGVAAILVEDGQRLTADFFIDATGFRSELLGKTLQEPYISYSPSLFNDRALVGSWQRIDEPVWPYTTAETMDAGWCWQIEHETEVNRGYVYSSSAISDDAAREELQRKNPKIQIRDRIVHFRTGRYQRAWVDNVLAIGNACGFVEPLQSTGQMVICWQSQTFVDLLQFVGDSPSIKALFNQAWGATWDEIRDFLTLHYWANTRLDTPYWQHCRKDTDTSRITPLLDFFAENGPTGFSRYFLKNTGSQFGIEGFLVMLVGSRVPYRNHHTATPAERQIIDARRAHCRALAQNGMDVKEALAFVKHPQWRWFGEK
jgi:tryptophan 7-halogenase